MPTGGISVTKESITEWIKAGAACLGIGSKLITRDLVAKGDWKGVKNRVTECLQHIKEAREG